MNNSNSKKKTSLRSDIAIKRLEKKFFLIEQERIKFSQLCQEKKKREYYEQIIPIFKKLHNIINEKKKNYRFLYDIHEKKKHRLEGEHNEDEKWYEDIEIEEYVDKVEKMFSWMNNIAQEMEKMSMKWKDPNFKYNGLSFEEIIQYFKDIIKKIENYLKNYNSLDDFFKKAKFLHYVSSTIMYVNIYFLNEYNSRTILEVGQCAEATLVNFINLNNKNNNFIVQIIDIVKIEDNDLIFEYIKEILEIDNPQGVMKGYYYHNGFKVYIEKYQKLPNRSRTNDFFLFHECFMVVKPENMKYDRVICEKTFHHIIELQDWGESKYCAQILNQIFSLSSKHVSLGLQVEIYPNDEIKEKYRFADADYDHAKPSRIPTGKDIEKMKKYLKNEDFKKSIFKKYKLAKVFSQDKEIPIMFFYWMTILNRCVTP